MKITDRQLINSFSTLGLQHNLLKAKLLAKAIKESTADVEKIIFYTDLHFELFQICEVFEMVIHAIKKMKNKKIPFWGTYVKYNANLQNAVKHLKAAHLYDKCPKKYFSEYLKLEINKFEKIYHKKTGIAINDDFYKNNLGNIIQALTLRTHDEIIKAYNKIKHGFTIPFLGKKIIYICRGIKENDKLDLIRLPFKEDQIDQTIKYIENFTEAIKNLLMFSIILPNQAIQRT